jgi:hypothetical protein
VSKTPEEAKAALLRAIPYFRHAIEEARKLGDVKMGILADKPDGSGELTMRFECEEFFADIALVIGAPEHTEQDESKAKALAFLQKHGLKVQYGDDQ